MYRSNRSHVMGECSVSSSDLICCSTPAFQTLSLSFHSKFHCVVGPKATPDEIEFLVCRRRSADLLRFCLSDYLIALLLTISSFGVSSLALSTNCKELFQCTGILQIFYCTVRFCYLDEVTAHLLLWKIFQFEPNVDIFFLKFSVWFIIFVYSINIYKFIAVMW